MPIDEKPGKARARFDKYRKLRHSQGSFHPAAFDERARLTEEVADGIIMRHEGNRERAIALLIHAFERWKTLGYKWRAAMVAIELAELSAGAESNDFLAEQALLRPNSWIAVRAKSLLTPA